MSLMTGGFLGLLPGGRALASPAAPQISDQARANAAGERVIIYSLGIQRVSVFGDDAKLIKSYLVSGHKGMPRLGRHRVYSKSPTTHGPKVANWASPKHSTRPISTASRTETKPRKRVGLVESSRC